MLSPGSADARGITGRQNPKDWVSNCPSIHCPLHGACYEFLVSMAWLTVGYNPFEEV